MNIDNIIKIIKEKQLNDINEYNNKVNSILNLLKDEKKETFLPEVFDSLFKFYHNHKQQGDIMITLLQKCSVNDFFKNSNTLNRLNDIEFSNENFKIRFSKHGNKTIEIVYQTLEYKKFKRIRIYDKDKEFYELLKKYYTTKKRKNLKSAIQYKINEYNAIQSNPMTFKETFRYRLKFKKRYNKDYFINLGNRINKSNKEDVEINKQNTIYECNYNWGLEFINNIDDIKIFIKNGWSVDGFGEELYK